MQNKSTLNNFFLELVACEDGIEILMKKMPSFSLEMYLIHKSWG